MKSLVYDASLAPYGLSRIDCSTYAQENHSRCNGVNYCFSQVKCRVMNHEFILTNNRRAKINKGGRIFDSFFKQAFSLIFIIQIEI